MSSDPWPWPGDAALARARRVALSYREALYASNPEMCRKLDTQMLRFGEGWVAPRPVVYGPDDYLSADLVANYAAVRLKTVYEWRRRGLASIQTNEGIRFRFADVQMWIAGRR